jgi:phosphoribosylformylglycinamidine synthase
MTTTTKTVPVLVLRAAGINCDEEAVHAWRLAGAAPALVHINRLAENPRLLADYAVVCIPGGFSYGDDIAAGAVLAQRITHELSDALRRHVDRGGGIVGICNGFQALVKTGFLPGPKIGTGRVTVTYNDSAHFEARWVTMRVTTDRCAFLTPGATLEMPVEHGEGKVIVRDDATLNDLRSGGFVALRYVDAAGRSDQYPANPNGSVDGIAGLCDDTGRVFGLMPHPDRHFDHTQHPLWTRRTAEGDPDGLRVFRSAVAYWR